MVHQQAERPRRHDYLNYGTLRNQGDDQQIRTKEHTANQHTQKMLQDTFQIGEVLLAAVSHRIAVLLNPNKSLCETSFISLFKCCYTPNTI